MKIFSLPPVLLVLFFSSHAYLPIKAADPREPGAYAVGVRTEIFVDEGRICAVTGKPRTLVTEIWYPVVKNSEPTKTNKFSDFWAMPGGQLMGKLVIGKFGGDFDQLDQNFKNVAMRDAVIDEGTFPLLIFSHGNGGLRHQNTFQAEYLASHGYVVAAADHTGNAAATILPDQVVPYSIETRKLERYDDRAHDVSFLISHLGELADEKEHWLFGRLDVEQLGAFGHSFGGFSVCRAAELDSRIKAILPMTLAGTALKGTESPACKVPMLVILANADRTVEEAGNELSTAYFEAATGPKFLLNFKDAGHYTFTEMLQINPDWGDGIGTEKDDDGNVTFTYSDAHKAQQITNEYSVAFFDAFLRHDAVAEAFLKTNHFPDELEYRRE